MTTPPALGMFGPTATDRREVEPTAGMPPAVEHTATTGYRPDGHLSEQLGASSSDAGGFPWARPVSECYGPFRRMCLMVGGEFFYEEIDGFTHEPGYKYHLLVERYDAFPGQKEPPQDAGRYGYRLVEVHLKNSSGR